MSTMEMTRTSVGESVRRAGPEILLAVLASCVFLGFLGSVDLWGKREQRAAAEAIDTVRNEHWLVAEIQSRPRLEKPPLPRWISASLMVVTGRSDETIVRLPNALGALATTALVYLLAFRLGGRSLAIASGLALCSIGYFVVEMRQAGNDGLLTLFTALAIYAAHRRVFGLDNLPGNRGWVWLFYAALGAGFLTKGPVILMLAGLAVVPALAMARNLRAGLRLLLDGWGVLLFVVMALLWPLPVAIRDPNAVRVWWLEIGQKTGAAGIKHSRDSGMLAADWPWVVLPWTPLAIGAILGPLFRSRRSEWSVVAWPWCWAVVNLAAFSVWSLSKPNYYLPCLPAIAILSGSEWLRLTRLAASGTPWARRLLKMGWTVAIVASAMAPVVAAKVWPNLTGWVVLAALALAGSALLSMLAWRKGDSEKILPPLVAGFVAIFLIAYGGLAPSQNAGRSHRVLASTLESLLPSGDRKILFFPELDEGLWFYLEHRDLAPVPGTETRYNRGFDLIEDAKRWEGDLIQRRNDEATKQLLAWAEKARAGALPPYVLIRGKIFDQFASRLEGPIETVYRETGVQRNGLVLLRARGAEQVATGQKQSEEPASGRGALR